MITYVLLRKRINELRKDFVRNDGLSELIRVVCESTKGKSCRLLDAWNVIEEEWSEESHDTCNESIHSKVSDEVQISNHKNSPKMKHQYLPAL